MFLKWLKKVFKMDGETKKEEKKSTDSAGKMPAQTSLIDEQRKNKVMRQFELQVFDEDLKDDGTTELKPVKMERAIIVEASTPEELKMILGQYRLCGQVAKIVREINPPPQAAVPPQALQPTASPLPNAKYQAAMFPEVSDRSDGPQMVAVQAPKPKSKPKVVTIGDMQVKYDGDKIYQKQWVKLNANEASNFRVVSDSTNKIVNLAGKHLEARRWIQVKETSEDSVDDAVEAILAGD